MRLSGFLLCFMLGGLYPMAPSGAVLPHDGGPALPVIMSERDSALFLEKQKVTPKRNSTALRTLAVAHTFLGTPYVKGCLDHNKDEMLTINLRQLDCWTFVENSVAIAKSQEGDFLDYQAHVQQLRYWGGNINGYGSRIHYFTGWLLQAEKNGLLKDVTKELGGIPYRKTISYISARPEKFPKVQQPNVLRELQAAEKRVNAHPWFYIPQNKIAQMEHLIQEGDIVSLTSAKRDLDVAHQGFAVKVNGHIHLMHASSLSHRVIISKQPLSSYVISQKGQTGIMVARLR